MSDVNIGFVRRERSELPVGLVTVNVGRKLSHGSRKALFGQQKGNGSRVVIRVGGGEGKSAYFLVAFSSAVLEAENVCGGNPRRLCEVNWGVMLAAARVRSGHGSLVAARRLWAISA